GGVGDEGDRVAAAPGVPGEQTGGQADRGGDGEREQRVLEVLQQAPGDAVVAVPVGGVAEEGVDEGEDVHRIAPSGSGRRPAAFGRRRVPAPERGIHGVSRRRSRTSRASQTLARTAMVITALTASSGRSIFCAAASRLPSAPWLPIRAPTLTREMLEAVATRRPAMMAGAARGNCTWA